MTEHEESPPPFDENPPIDPSEPRVGDSKAVFFQPTEQEEGEDPDEGEERTGEEGEPGRGAGGDDEE